MDQSHDDARASVRPAEVAFDPGVRLSPSDVVVLVIMAAIAAGAATLHTGAAILCAVAFGHFFLFCNVFRVARALELAWSAAFVVLAAVALTTPALDAWLAALIACFLGAIAIATEVRKPSYHGVLWQKLNPGLEAWWRDTHAKPERPSP